jgi:hypothetical protein
MLRKAALPRLANPFCGYHAKQAKKLVAIRPVIVQHPKQQSNRQGSILSLCERSRAALGLLRYSPSWDCSVCGA